MTKANNTKKSKGEFDTFINFIPSAVLWLDRDLNIQAANDLFLSIIGKSQKEVVGTNLSEHPLKNLQQYFVHIGLLKNYEIKVIDYLHTDEGKKTIRFYIQEVVNENSYMVTGIDITNEIYRTEANEEARRQHEENTRFMLIGQIASGVAHEINNPLAIISGLLFNMKKSLERDEGKVSKDYFIEKISKSLLNIDRIAMIVRGLKFLSKNDINSPFEEVHIKEIIDHALDLCADKFKTSGVTLTIGETTNDMVVNCRPVPLTQVIINLLMNAHEAVEDCETKWIKINFELNEKNFIISVIDSGKGIPDEIKDKIMQPFFTTKIANKRVGLGLSTSQIIVQDHLADLVYDEKSPDTKFSIIF